MLADSAPHGRLPVDFALERVDLSVADRSRSLDFYAGVLGLVETPARPGGPANVGVVSGDGYARTLIRLHAREGALTSVPRATGLFHLALLLPSRRDLAAFVRHRIATGTPVAGASDHAVSEAIYLEDPDGHGVEVYADRPPAHWPREGPALIMRTDPLDVDDLLAELDGDGVAGRSEASEGWRAPAGTTLGHVHLRVSDLPEARRFYVDTFGFEETATYPGASFLSAGGYHHHAALNTWTSAGATPAPDTTARLLGVHASLADAEGLSALRRRVASTSAARNPVAGNSGLHPSGEPTSDPTIGSEALTFHDPSGIRWTLTLR